MTVHSKDKLPKEKNCTVCDKVSRRNQIIMPTSHVMCLFTSFLYKLISVRAMDTHMRIHTRPFICNDCGKV